MIFLRHLLFASIGFFPLSVFSGEIVGDAFVGNKNGSIHISLQGGRWLATDTERNSPTSVAYLRLATPVAGSQPSCDVTSAPGMAGEVEHDMLAEMIRKGMLDAGMDLGPPEVRHYGGRQVIRFNTVLNLGSGGAKGETFVLRGRTDYFVVNCSANVVAYEAAKPLFEDLVERIRY